MYLTTRQKQRIKIKFLWIFYDIITRSSLYFIAGFILGVSFVLDKFIKAF